MRLQYYGKDLSCNFSGTNGGKSSRLNQVRGMSAGWLEGVGGFPGAGELQILRLGRRGDLAQDDNALLVANCSPWLLTA